MGRRLPGRRDPIGHYRRREVAQRRVGVDARCACGESRASALVAGTTPITCERCVRVRKGHSVLDRHHVAGRANDPTTIAVPANDHIAACSERQYDWPRETRENPDGDPALRAAACIRGFVDTICYLIERTLLWIATMLEQWSASERARRGTTWWRGTALEQFTPTKA